MKLFASRHTISFCLVALICQAVHGQTSDNNSMLRRALEQYPQADTNGDGVLTMAEGKAFRNKFRGNKNRPAGVKPDHADLVYGPHDRNRIDLWLAESDTPTPLVICIHGGGFSGGDKKSFHQNANLINRMRDEGISVAAINYRLTEGGKHPYPAPMHDGARAVQFMRLHSAKYNLDKTRFAATGGSAGGCMSMWLGFHDDLSDADNDDPVLRESTRLLAVAPSAGQSCVHMPTLLKWFEVTKLTEHGGARPLFGISGKGEIQWTPELDALTRDASPITHLSSDDPPCFMTFGANKPINERSAPNLWVHHPIMGFNLRDAMTEQGLECYVQHQGGPAVKPYRSQIDFLIQKLTDAN